MHYYELSFSLTPLNEINSDCLVYLLGEIGFESFEKTDKGINTYISEKIFNKDTVDNQLVFFPIKNVQILYTVRLIHSENWNEVWEKNFFKPMTIDDQCIIHSSFHQHIPTLPYDIIIDPKMAFGTGHHETTHLMVSFLLPIDVHRKSFLDMGCGTAILAILAGKKGATPVLGIDIDEWACNNALENIQLNHLPEIQIWHGDAQCLQGKQFDYIFANINRNILLQDIPAYVSCMTMGAHLYMSGFYMDDIPVILSVANQYRLNLIDQKQKNNWAALHFQYVSH